MSDKNSSIVSIYRKKARNYDLTTKLYYLLGVRFQAYRKEAVNSLELEPGDTVLDLGCGTGLNFPSINAAVGPRGKIIGVDITDKMLDQAKNKVQENGWENIELVHMDVARYDIPKNIDGVISTFALTYSNKYDKVIYQSYVAVKPSKKFALLDIKMSSGRARIFWPLLEFSTRPFGGLKEYVKKHPWKSVEKYFDEYIYKEMYGGFIYLITGTKSSKTR
jgi:demethylmenaquinone methyltransferase/2-methoxy-6-polyprenyl-1,4-benzoquinol methylase